MCNLRASYGNDGSCGSQAIPFRSCTFRDGSRGWSGRSDWFGQSSRHKPNFQHSPRPTASRSVQAILAWSAKTRRAPLRPGLVGRHARVYAHTKTATHGILYTSPPPHTHTLGSQRGREKYTSNMRVYTQHHLNGCSLTGSRCMANEHTPGASYKRGYGLRECAWCSKAAVPFGVITPSGVCVVWPPKMGLQH